MKTIIHKYRDYVAIDGKGDYGVTLEVNDRIFTMSILEEKTQTILHSYEYEDEGISRATARGVAKEYGEYMTQTNRLNGLLAREIGKTLGFEVDFSKGIKHFFEELAKCADSEELELHLQWPDCKPYRNAMENELKKRGENKNDKLDYVGSSKQ